MFYDSDHNYRQILRSELSARLGKNPLYSLRAFARDLQMGPARLSDVLSGKKGLSKQAALVVAKAIGFTHEEQIHFCDLVEAEHARSPIARTEAKIRVKARKKAAVDVESAFHLSADRFKLIEDWRHHAVFQLLKLKSQSQEPEAMADRLSISVHEVKDALARLARAKLIEKQSSRWKAVQNKIIHQGAMPSVAIRRFHDQLLDKAKQSLAQDSIDRRTLRSTVLSVSAAHLPLIEERIKKFSEEIMQEFSTASADAEVAALTVQFFPLSRSRSMASEGGKK